MKATLFKKPDGCREEIDITEIDEEDEKFFVDNKVSISLEESVFGPIVYADAGYTVADTEDEEPDEFMTVSGTRGCREVMKELRAEVEEILKSDRPRFVED